MFIANDQLQGGALHIIVKCKLIIIALILNDHVK